MKWALELEEYEVIYRPRTAIKGQALANVLLKFSYPEKTEQTEPISLPLTYRLLSRPGCSMLTDPARVRSQVRLQGL